MATYRISTPVPGITAVIGKCAFADGVYTGPVEPGPLMYFRQAGYTIEALDTEPHAEPVEPAPAKSAAKADWVAYAVVRGMDEADAEQATKDELIKLYWTGDTQ